MSAGSFVKATYKASGLGGATCRILVQPETLEAMSDGVLNASVSGLPTLALSVQVRGSKRTLGIVARTVYLKIGVSIVPPDGYVIGSRTSIPALTPEFFNACMQSGFCTYLGGLWEVTGGKAETIR